jgi:transmembrane sensor
MSAGAMDHARLSLRVRAEAAAWLVGLRSADRTSELDDRFRRWLAECEANRIAWERQSEAWELAEALRSKFGSARSAADIWPGVGRRSRMISAIAAVLSAAIVAWMLAMFIPRAPDALVTATGERRVVLLPDRSRVTLNTDTRIIVRYDRLARRIRLERGEALFNVRKDAVPFIVDAGAREIRSLGTAFEIRRDGGGRVSVTLVEGRISISSLESWTSRGSAPATVLAAPGQRVTYAPHRAPQIDHPVLREVIAWQSGEVVFDNTPLPEAIREMNRYSALRIVIEEPNAARLHVGGLFQAGESLEFAQAVAQTFGLSIRQDGARIVLSRPPEPSRPAEDYRPQDRRQ